MYLGLRITRGIVGFIAVWQLLSLLPVITWMANPATVTSTMVMVVAVKGIVLVSAGAAYFWLRDYINKRHAHQMGAPRLLLHSQWSL